MGTHPHSICGHTESSPLLAPENKGRDVSQRDLSAPTEEQQGREGLGLRVAVSCQEREVWALPRDQIQDMQWVPEEDHPS